MRPKQRNLSALCVRSESLAAVGQATTQVAHEIRNPLGSIRLGVSMLRDSVTNDPDALNTIELVERGISHLNKLVVDVTQYSRQKELERSTVDLHESLERSIDLVSERIREKNATVERVFAGRSIVGQWDPYQLRQVFVNVIANAVDASQENSAVMISTELLPSEIERRRPAAENIRAHHDCGSGEGNGQGHARPDLRTVLFNEETRHRIRFSDREANRGTTRRPHQRRQRTRARIEVQYRSTCVDPCHPRSSV